MDVPVEPRAHKKEEKVKKRLKALLNIAMTNNTDSKKRKRKYPDIGNDITSSPTTDEDGVPKPKKTLKKGENNGLTEIVLESNDIEQLKLAARALKKSKAQAPLLYLTEDGLNAQLNLEPGVNNFPLFMSDIQHLTLYSVIGAYSPCYPRWCKLLRCGKISHTVVLLIENVGITEFNASENFKKTKQLAQLKLEMISPGNVDSSLAMDLLWTPLSCASKLFYKGAGYVKSEKREMTIEAKDKTPHEAVTNKDKFPRTQLLLSPAQMIEENYPLPIYTYKYKDFLPTKDEYAPVTDKSPMFSVDCEMCLTAEREMALTRVAVVDESLDVLYDSLVKPRSPIINYLTQFSGITPTLLKGVTTTIDDVREKIRKHLPADAILIGQSLNSDLTALKMTHPYVIDTSIIYNLSGIRRRKTGLKMLCKTFLNEEIQASLDGHCPVEDSRTALQLVLLKLSKDIKFGDCVLDYPGLISANHINTAYTCSILSRFLDREKSVTIVSTDEIIKMYKLESDLEKMLNQDRLKMESENDWKSVLKKTRNVSIENHLTISHVDLKFDSPNGLDSHTKVLQRLDKYIGKIGKSMAKNSLFIVVFGGAEYPDGMQNGNMYTNAVCLTMLKNGFEKKE